MPKIARKLSAIEIRRLTKPGTYAVGGVKCMGCTEEARNKLSRTTDNYLGEDLRVSYIDGGQVVKSWTVKDGKITSGKADDGTATGYYYFWSE